MARTKGTARRSYPAPPELLPKKNPLEPIDGDDPDTMSPVRKRVCVSPSDCEDLFNASSSSDESNAANAPPTVIPVVLRAEDISREIRVRRNKMRKVAKDVLRINAKLDAMLQRTREVADDLIRLSNEIDTASAVISAKI